jgi:osmotically-inducible protein OsmY
MWRKKMKKISLTLTITSMALSACVPALIGGGAAVVGGAMVKEKGVSGSLSDTQISTKLSIALYKKDPILHSEINTTVQNGEVMLTGAVPTNEMHLDAVRIAWETPGVKRVIDNIAVSSEGASAGVYAKDAWITTQLKSKLLFDEHIQSLNYSIKTVSGQVYLMGIAQDQTELRTVVEYARTIDGVQKVISYVRLKDDMN